MKFISAIALTLIGTAFAAPAPVAAPEPKSTDGYVYCYQCPGEPVICLPYIPIRYPCDDPKEESK